MSVDSSRLVNERSFYTVSRLLGDSFIAKLLVHGKPPEVSASALDALLAVELETVAVEEWSGHKTGVSSNSRGANRAQRKLDALVKAARNPATRERGMSEEEVQVSLMGIGSEACENVVRLGNNGVKPRQALLPAHDIGWNWCPGGNLLRRVVSHSQRTNRCGVSLDNARQVGGIILPFVHKSRAESPNGFPAPSL